MRCSTLIGFLVVLLKQHCTSEGGSTPIHLSTEVTYQDSQTLPQEQGFPTAEMVPVVSPPSLKEVQQAVQDASEQVDGRGAEEVLKELLERVVEAALGQAEAVGEAKDAAMEKKAVDKDALGVKTGEQEAETEAEILEQLVDDKNVSLKEGKDGFEEKEGKAEVGAFEHVAVGEKEVVKGEGAEPIEKSAETVETREAESLEVTDESLGAKFSQEDKERASEEMEGDSETGKEDGIEQVVLSVIKNVTETEIQTEKEALSPVEVAVDVQPEQETVNESKPGLGVADDEQIGNNWGKEAALKKDTQIEKMDGEKKVLPSKDYEIKITKPVIGEPAEEEEEEVTRGEYAEGHEEQDENGHLVEGGGEEKVKIPDINLRGETVDKINEEGVVKEESVASVNETGDEKTEEEEEEKEEQIPLENLHHSDDQETPVNPGLLLENSTESFIEKTSKNQPPTLNPSMEMEENTIGDETLNYGSRIITPTHGFLTHNHGRIQPTLDNFENDVLAEYHQSKEGKPEKTNDLVENTPGIKETNKQGLEAWKFGAIFAAVFLALETVIIIIYIIKCRNKKSAPTVQQACEEGCVEPEAATTRGCNDDTRPTSDTQQVATRDLSDVASALAKDKKQQEDEHVISLANLLPSSTEEPATTGTGPNFSLDLRTSV